MYVDLLPTPPCVDYCLFHVLEFGLYVSLWKPYFKLYCYVWISGQYRSEFVHFVVFNKSCKCYWI